MSRWGQLFSRRKRMMEDLDQDIRDFIERETQDNIERGLLPEEAQRLDSSHNIEACPDGEIGRRSGLKIRREQSHGGSSPPPGTIFNILIISNLTAVFLGA